MDIYAELQRLGALVRQLQGLTAPIPDEITALQARKTTNTGTGSATFSAASNQTATFAHGLGATPTYVNGVPTNSVNIAFQLVSADATNATLRAFTTTGLNISATITFDWFAVA